MLAETAEETGYEALFVPEIAGREAFSTLTAVAARTSSLLLGSGVVPLTSRTPFVTAMAATTVQEVSDGRLILGIGSGMPPGGALDRVRRAVATLRAAFAGDMVDGGALSLLPPKPVPIWLAALGDRMIGLAGEVADGVVLNWCTPERVGRALELLAEGAARAGREPADVTVAVYVRACVGTDDETASQALREAAAMYTALPHYAAIFAEMGLDPGDPDQVAKAVCVSGTAANARARLDAFRQAGADLPVVYPVPAMEPVSSLLGTIMAMAPSALLEP
jgi:alkanesulfonate monooxygenase SsuD/methylene tetrahydromethanopterin reductase-like flavin-dependent oxidoreductase (luciferase family)